MVLNMADFGKFLEIAPNSVKRFQTPPKLIFNALHDCLRRFRVNSRGRKLADFEQKAWDRAYTFEHGRFWQVQEIAPNSLKRLLNPSKMISDSLRDTLRRFRVNSEVSKIGRFWAKGLGYSP